MKIRALYHRKADGTPGKVEFHMVMNEAEAKVIRYNFIVAEAGKRAEIDFLESLHDATDPNIRYPGSSTITL